jgi:putative hydrolase of the HAD superfamily
LNVVFDLGGVVVAWRPDDIVARAFADPDHRVRARRQIIGHNDWLELDRGTMSYDDAIARGAQRTGLSESAVRSFVESVPASLVVYPETVALIQRVKDAGNALYCLSNMPPAAMDYLERVHSFWHLFSGVVVSSRVRFLKPEPEIYQHLLDTYALRPPDTVFIDDTLANLEAAQRFGIRTIHFTSASQCEAELRRLGCL